MWQPAPVQPGGQRHLLKRMQVPPWAQGGEHMAEIHSIDHASILFKAMLFLFFFFYIVMMTPNQQFIITKHNTITPLKEPCVLEYLMLVWVLANLN